MNVFVPGDGFICAGWCSYVVNNSGMALEATLVLLVAVMAKVPAIILILSVQF